MYLYAGKDLREFIFPLLGSGTVAHELDVGTSALSDIFWKPFSSSLFISKACIFLACSCALCHSSQCGYVGIVRRTAAYVVLL